MKKYLKILGRVLRIVAFVVVISVIIWGTFTMLTSEEIIIEKITTASEYQERVDQKMVDTTSEWEQKHKVWAEQEVSREIIAEQELKLEALREKELSL